MDAFFNWYGGLDSLLAVFWGIAIITSAVFLIQMVLTLVGIGDTDADAGMDAMDAGMGVDGDTLDTGGAMQLFTVRNVTNFLLGLGWGGVCFWDAVGSHFWIVVVSLLCGGLFVAIFMFMYRQLLKLQHGGNFRIEDCVGLTCSVYLRIPAQRQASGKVQVSIHGSVLEIGAMTDADTQLPSGSKVRVVQVIDSNTVLVEAL